MATKKLIMPFSNALRLRELCCSVKKYIDVIMQDQRRSKQFTEAGLELECDLKLIGDFTKPYHIIMKNDCIYAKIPSFALTTLNKHLDRIVQNSREVANECNHKYQALPNCTDLIISKEDFAYAFNTFKRYIKRDISKIGKITQRYVKEEN